MHLRTRLSLTFVVVVSPVLLLFLANFYYYFSTSNRDYFLNIVKNRGVTMTHLMSRGESLDRSLLRWIDEGTYTSLSNRRVAIFDEQNQLLYDSGELDDKEIQEPPFTITEPLLQQITSQKVVSISDGERMGYGLLLHNSKGQRYKVVSYAIDDYGQQKMHEMITVSVATLVIAFLVVIVLSQIFARRSIKPISNMIEKIEQIKVSNLELRLPVPPDADDELSRLAVSFNQMLDRISSFEMQRSFVSNASHELRTPLTLITNQIEVSLIKPRSSEEYQNLLKSLLEDINRLNALSNGLLELAQFDVKEIQVTWATVQLDEVIYEAVASVLHKYPNYRISFATDAQDEDESLPAIAIRGEESLLQMAFMNLIENGCKFSSDHHTQITVKPHSDYVEVLFEDQGIGIAESELDYIFQPFYRATNSHAIKGNGIGLSLTEKIIKLHRGRIMVTSLLDQGTRFQVDLPSLPALNEEVKES
ncbi:sensor histidine kinase [Siphonobacter curvatus]|uniref:histidine kinase n=1 Tax=Siphonobacter curvatus TaxID=2094562 RepID=A0A2S7IG85_9BACT|nr:HAMP domain-containing sensor histidine kinase [Siphonobacter curvatus]PQA54408.1 hypothetical protein C5O19_21910 [Siphonobacter curvatus]